MPWLLALIVALVPSLTLPGRPVSPQAAAEADLGSKVWVGRYAEFEEFIRSAPIQRIEDVGSGVTRPRRGFFAPGGLAGSVTLKNLPPRRTRGFFESYKSEVAAYLMDRLLELDMVPPTVARTVDGTELSAQLWLEGVRLFGDAKGEAPPDGRRWIRQVNRQKAFDDLIGNIDENEGNMLIDDEWNLVLIDHSRCFTSTNRLPFELVQIDRPFYERLKSLDETQVAERVGPWLERGALDAMMRRRDAVIAQIEKLVADKGELAVLTP